MCVMYNPFVCTYGGGGMLDPHNWRAKDVNKMVKTFFWIINYDPRKKIYLQGR